MAMLMEELEVLVPVLPALGQWHEVVDFPAVLHREQQSTAAAVSPLLLE